jgi:hypothetical protein
MSRRARDPGQDGCVLLFVHVAKARPFDSDRWLFEAAPSRKMRYIAPRTQEPRPQLPLESRNSELALRTCFRD